MGKTKFNFNSAPAAQEINEQMDIIQNAQVSPAIPAKSPRTSGESWTLVQARVPKDIQQRMAVYCALNNIKKGDIVVAALREYLDRVQA